MEITINLKKETVAAVMQRRQLLETASNIDAMPSAEWNKLFDRAQAQIASVLAYEIEKRGIDILDFDDDCDSAVSFDDSLPFLQDD